jgi:hypothetical protein
MFVVVAPKRPTFDARPFSFSAWSVLMAGVGLGGACAAASLGW